MAEVQGANAQPDAGTAAFIDVVVAYSLTAGEACEVAVTLPAHATVAAALQAAQLADVAGTCGVWGRVCAPETRLQPGDRVEFYRSLTVDPKVARRERFVSQGARGAGLFAKRRTNSKAGY